MKAETENDLGIYLQKMGTLVAITSDGLVTILKHVGSAEDFIITCLVAQKLAHRLGKTSTETMSVDDLIGAGGMTQRLARQTVYNATSSLAKSKIIQKRGNEFFVDERTVLQYVAAKLSN